MPWLYLAIAIVAEVVATSALKESQEFSRIGPSTIVVIGYGVAFYLLAVVLRTMPVGIAYAIWSGAGMVLIAIVGWIRFRQALDVPAILGMLLIGLGVLIINVFSKSVAH